MNRRQDFVIINKKLVAILTVKLKDTGNKYQDLAREQRKKEKKNSRQ